MEQGIILMTKSRVWRKSINIHIDCLTIDEERKGYL